MSDSTCVSCQKPKAAFDCEVCGDSSCKKCGHLLDRDAFSFLPEVPEDLRHTYYCGHCYDRVVAPELDLYQERMNQAKGVFVFFKTQRKEIPLIKREREVFHVDACADRDETILRLAFFSALQGHNAIIEVDVTAEKIRDEAYQTSKWRGTGVAATVDGAKIEAQDLRNRMYR